MESVWDAETKCCLNASLALLMHELPLPASAVVGGGRCCWCDVLRVAVVGRDAVVVGVLVEGLEEALIKLLAAVWQQSHVSS